MKVCVYTQWVGLALLASAGTLFIVVSDPKRYLPFLYVNIAARGLAVLLTVFYITHFTLFIAILPSHAALAAILVGALVYELKLGQYSVSVSRTGGEGKKPGKPPAPKPAAGKKGPAKAESKKPSSGGSGKG
jgi:hypothetical protein